MQARQATHKFPPRNLVQAYSTYQLIFWTFDTSLCSFRVFFTLIKTFEKEIKNNSYFRNKKVGKHHIDS